MRWVAGALLALSACAATEAVPVRTQGTTSTTEARNLPVELPVETTTTSLVPPTSTTTTTTVVEGWLWYRDGAGNCQPLDTATAKEWGVIHDPSCPDGTGPNPGWDVTPGDTDPG